MELVPIKKTLAENKEFIEHPECVGMGVDQKQCIKEMTYCACGYVMILNSGFFYL